jgi:hypothetical protein
VGGTYILLIEGDPTSQIIDAYTISNTNQTYGNDNGDSSDGYDEIANRPVGSTFLFGHFNLR